MLGAALLLVFATALIHDDVKPADETSALEFDEISVKATPVPLFSQDMSRNEIDQLSYLKGWSLTSDYKGFGGFSGMRIAGNQLVAINDRGYWLTATLDTANTEQPITEARMFPFEPEARGAEKILYDAEGLSPAPFGFLVSFEQEHRIVAVWEPGEKSAMPPALNAVDYAKYLTDNNGIEAIAFADDDHLMLFAEQGRDWRGSTPAWEINGKAAISRRYFGPKNHAPTAALGLPDGSLLVVNRLYSRIEGQSIILTKITAENIADGNLIGEPIADFSEGVTKDNFEGISLVGMEGGKPVIALISDDNFIRKATHFSILPPQRTLLMLFRYDGYQMHNGLTD